MYPLMVDYIPTDDHQPVLEMAIFNSKLALKKKKKKKKIITSASLRIKVKIMY